MRRIDDPDTVSMSVPINTGKNGYVGRECPDCHKYFKVTPGTGLTGSDLPCICPYCGRKGPSDDFSTQDQKEYAKSVAVQDIEGDLNNMLKKLEFDTGPVGSFGIGMSLKVDHWSAPPLHVYEEKDLETYVECPSCSLKYAVYGVFAYCPDCGQHNSLQILTRNLDIVSKELDIAASSDADVCGALVANALEDCVSAFDGFGREICHIHAGDALANAPKIDTLSFQSLSGARTTVKNVFGIDFAAACTTEDWDAAVRNFQKRHVLSHKSGVVDEEYVRKSGDTSTPVGHKLVIEPSEVRQLTRTLVALGTDLAASLADIHHEEKS
jgi:hypothetical protein